EPRKMAFGVVTYTDERGGEKDGGPVVFVCSFARGERRAKLQTKTTGANRCWRTRGRRGPPVGAEARGCALVGWRRLSGGGTGRRGLPCQGCQGCQHFYMSRCHPLAVHDLIAPGPRGNRTVAA